MLEKTFVDSFIEGREIVGISQAQRELNRIFNLTEKRNKTIQQLSLMLDVPHKEIQIVEGLDTWLSAKGRYEGEAIVLGQPIKFASQTYYKNNEQLYTHIMVNKAVKKTA